LKEEWREEPAVVPSALVAVMTAAADLLRQM